MTEIVDLARGMAAALPDATLACPVCAAMVNARNLEPHLDRVHHGGDDAGLSWHGRGWQGGRLRWDDGTLRWRSRTGLRRRRIRPAAVVLGSTHRHKSYGLYASSAERTLSVDVHSGSYIRVVAEDGRSIKVRCRSGVSARKAWDGWESGSRLKWVQITVKPDALVALLYLLAQAGVLQPAERRTSLDSGL